MRLHIAIITTRSLPRRNTSIAACALIIYNDPCNGPFLRAALITHRIHCVSRYFTPSSRVITCTPTYVRRVQSSLAKLAMAIKAGQRRVEEAELSRCSQYGRTTRWNFSSIARHLSFLLLLSRADARKSNLRRAHEVPPSLMTVYRRTHLPGCSTFITRLSPVLPCLVE